MPGKRPACRIIVLISGGGSNLQALIDNLHDGELATIIAVVSNNPDAYGLQRAAAAGIATATLDHRHYPSRDAYDQQLMQLIDSYQPDLLLLAGFMRILSDPLVNHYHGRMINIHPSLLPKYRGLHTHQRAIEAGDREAGCSVHFVTPQLDSGPLIIQARVPLYRDDDAATLAARVLKEEHRIYPAAARWFAAGRLQLSAGIAMLDGHPIYPSLN
ncbi:MAG: phosphoribosylglycinamide formyltransferase [Gammaproteobacteria bacterium]|nr:phosphoribosylglycinamide formyltransferase [Gammaproteobacteria bacterium]